MRHVTVLWFRSWNLHHPNRNSVEDRKLALPMMSFRKSTNLRSWSPTERFALRIECPILFEAILAQPTPVSVKEVHDAVGAFKNPTDAFFVGCPDRGRCHSGANLPNSADQPALLQRSMKSQSDAIHRSPVRANCRQELGKRPPLQRCPGQTEQRIDFRWDQIMRVSGCFYLAS